MQSSAYKQAEDSPGEGSPSLPSSYAQHTEKDGGSTWLVFMLGASRLGGVGVMNLGQAYWNSSSYADSPPRVIFCILSPCLRARRSSHASRRGAPLAGCVML